MSEKKEFKMIHSEKYGLSLELAKKFVGKQLYRPILQYVKHDANGDIWATDSHRALHIKAVHGFEKELLVNPKSLDFATGDYPKVNEIFKNYGGHYNAIVIVSKDNLDAWIQTHKSFAKMKSWNKTIKVSINDEKVNFELLQQEITFNLPYSEKHTTPEFDFVCYNADYMVDALEVFKKLNLDKIELRFTTKLAPFVVTDSESKARVLILPVRANE